MTPDTRGAVRPLALALLAAALAFPVPVADAAGPAKKTKAKAVAAEPIPLMPAEIPMPATYNWAGYYVGGFVGGAHGLWTLDFYRNNNHGHAEEGQDGIEAGGLVGYNVYLQPNVIAGVEADLGLTSAKETNNIFDNDTSLAEFNAFGSIRGRLGYAMDRWLIYGTAGLAFANLTNEIQKGRNAGEQIVSDGQTRVGYALGAGLEYAVTDHWLTRAEYLYENFGTASQTNADGNLAEMNNQLHQLRLGVSYKF